MGRKEAGHYGNLIAAIMNERGGEPLLWNHWRERLERATDVLATINSQLNEEEVRARVWERMKENNPQVWKQWENREITGVGLNVRHLLSVPSLENSNLYIVSGIIKRGGSPQLFLCGWAYSKNVALRKGDSPFRAIEATMEGYDGNNEESAFVDEEGRVKIVSSLSETTDPQTLRALVTTCETRARHIGINDILELGSEFSGN